jgi:hypothetical protein
MKKYDLEAVITYTAIILGTSAFWYGVYKLVKLFL